LFEHFDAAQQVAFVCLMRLLLVKALLSAPASPCYLQAASPFRNHLQETRDSETEKHQVWAADPSQYKRVSLPVGSEETEVASDGDVASCARSIFCPVPATQAMSVS
jgi:hypothetical protein